MCVDNIRVQYPSASGANQLTKIKEDLLMVVISLEDTV